MDKPWRAEIEDLDTEVLAAQTMAAGSAETIIGLALALIDAGVLDKGRLLDIIECLRVRLQIDHEDKIGDHEDAELPLDLLHAALSGYEWKAGQVLDDLRKQETILFDLLQKRIANRKRPER